MNSVVVIHEFKVYVLARNGFLLLVCREFRFRDSTYRLKKCGALKLSSALFSKTEMNRKNTETIGGNEKYNINEKNDKFKKYREKLHC